MNEHIRQLAEQANFSISEDKANKWFIIQGSGHHLEKFAELIVCECAQVADIKRDTSAGCGYVTYTDGQRIKKHFGVDV